MGSKRAAFQSWSDHEHDERWTQVDTYVNGHLHPIGSHNNDFLQKTLEHSLENGLPDISIFPTFGKFLALQCKIGNAKHVLEVGTLGGYSALWFVSEIPGLKVTSIEYNPHHAKIARENIAAAGYSDRVEVIEGAGMDVLPDLLSDVKAGKRPAFDFAFIDADKINNWGYFDLAVKMGKGSGMCIIVDNVVRRGKLGKKELAKHDMGVKGAMELVENVGKDKRVSATVLQTVAEKSYDGFLMAVVI